MPVTKHLNRLDITDFTAGLWDEKGTSTLLTPPNAFATLTDYEPKPGGGLRAFFAGTNVLTTGLDNTATEIVEGLFARGSVVGSAGTEHDLLLVTMTAADFKTRIYRMKMHDGETTWTKVYTDSAGGSDGGFQEAQFCMLKEDSDGLVHYLISVKGGGNKGVYNLTFSGVSAARFITYVGPILTVGARALYVDGGVIRYSDVGLRTITSTATQFLNVNPNQPGATIGMLSERAPADVLVGMWAAPWYEINGAIDSASTPVRALGDMHHQRVHYQTPCRAPGGGIFFIEPGGRIYKTDGLNFQSMSDAILRFNVNADGSALYFGPGKLAVLDDYLFAPRGYVCDLRSGAWFKSSFMPAVTFLHATKEGRVFHADTVAGPDLGYMKVHDGPDAGVSRCTTGTIQTVPFHDAEGKNIRIREVQLQVQTYTASGFVVSIVNSIGKTVATDTVTGVTGRGQVVFRFPNVQDEYLSVKVVPSATNGTSEAPTIERMTVFFGPNNTILNAAS